MTTDACWPFGCHVCGSEELRKLDLPCLSCGDPSPALCKADSCKAALTNGRTFPKHGLFTDAYQALPTTPVVDLDNEARR